LAFARALAVQLSGPLADRDRVVVRRHLRDAQQANPDIVYAFVASPDGEVTDHSFATGSFPADLLQLSERPGPTTVSVEDGTVRDLVAPIAEGRMGSVHVGASTAWVEGSIYDSVTRVLLATALALLVGLAGILLIANLITRPMLGLVGAARRLESGDHSSSAPIVGRDEIAHLANTFNEMAARIRKQMAESDALRAYVERILDHVDSSIIVVSEDGVIDYANSAVTEAYGEVAGKKCDDVLRNERPCPAFPIAEVFSAGQVLRRSHTSASGRSYELTYVPMIEHEGRRLVVETCLEVTAQRELADRVARAERLALAGEIAAGFVHTINNPLDGVNRALDLAKRHIKDPERASEMLDLATEGVERITAVTQTLLGFARVDRDANVLPAEVNSMVEEAAGLMRLKAESESIELELDLAPSLPQVAVDPQAMADVLLNLLINAVDACGDDGKITVRTSSTDGSLVEITTIDDGDGIPEELVEQIFEPFFTTKEVGRGTGLGLSLARRIVEGHGGEIHAESPEGGGAVFRIRLPVSTAEASA